MSQPDDSTVSTPLLRPTLLPLQRWLRRDLWILLLIFCLFYCFRLGQFSISIDDEFEAAGNYSNVWILTGRWAGFFIDRYLLPQTTIPFLPIFLFGFFMCLAYRLLLRTFDVAKPGPVHYLAFPFFIALPTWTYLTAFAANIASAGIGCLLATVALWRFRQCTDVLGGEAVWRVPGSPRAVTAMLSLAVAMGLYQSFLFCFVVPALALLLLASARESFSWSLLWRQLLVMIVIVLGAAIFYLAADSVLRAAYGLNDRAYLGHFIDWHALLQTPWTVIARALGSMGTVYGGSQTVYGISAIAFPLVLLAGLWTITALPDQNPGQRTAQLLLAAAMFAAPFTQHFLSGGGMPARTLVAVPTVFWFYALIGMSARRFWLAATSFVVVLVAMLQILYSSTLLQTANYFARQHDQVLAEAVYERIVAVQPAQDDTRNLVVDFFGAKKFETIYPRPHSLSVGFSFFEWDGGNEGRMLAYLRLLGYTNLRAPSLEQRKQDLAIFKQMPVWPARDSVRVAGEVTLIKLGPTPGYPFNTQ